MSTENIEPLAVSDLYLDELNPRLPTNVRRRQHEMARYLARNSAITELMTTIAEHGYFPGEPIIVVPRDAGGYWTVEGNRRLTALRLLRDPSLLPKSSRVREISESAEHIPDSVPCVVFTNRSQIVNYLGYRHITGVKQWEPLAKARYLAQYFRLETRATDPPQVRYRAVARGIGSQAPYIKRQLDGISVYEHIEECDFYEIEDVDEETLTFSLLSTGVGYKEILNFVSSNADPFIYPEALRADPIRELTHWMYETDERGRTVLGDSRNIQRLALIVADQHALDLLREDHNLARAYGRTKGMSRDFYDVLNDIENQLSRAIADVALVDLDDGHRSKIEDIFRQARALRRIADDES